MYENWKNDEYMIRDAVSWASEKSGRTVQFTNKNGVWICLFRDEEIDEGKPKSMSHPFLRKAIMYAAEKFGIYLLRS